MTWLQHLWLQLHTSMVLYYCSSFLLLIDKPVSRFKGTVSPELCVNLFRFFKWINLQKLYRYSRDIKKENHLASAAITLFCTSVGHTLHSFLVTLTLKITNLFEKRMFRFLRRKKYHAKAQLICKKIQIILRNNCKEINRKYYKLDDIWVF